MSRYKQRTTPIPSAGQFFGFLGVLSGVGMVGYLVWLDFPLAVAFLRDCPEVLAATALVCLLGLAALIVGSALRGRG